MAVLENQDFLAVPYFHTDFLTSSLLSLSLERR